MDHLKRVVKEAYSESDSVRKTFTPGTIQELEVHSIVYSDNGVSKGGSGFLKCIFRGTEEFDKIDGDYAPNQYCKQDFSLSPAIAEFQVYYNPSVFFGDLCDFVEADYDAIVNASSSYEELASNLEEAVKDFPFLALIGGKQKLNKEGRAFIESFITHRGNPITPVTDENRIKLEKSLIYFRDTKKNLIEMLPVADSNLEKSTPGSDTTEESDTADDVLEGYT